MVRRWKQRLDRPDKQILRTHSSGLLWAAWANGSSKYVVDSGRLDGASDVFVYTLQTGVCQTASGCEVFPGVSVNEGKPIYKNYAVVSAIGNTDSRPNRRTGSAVHIYDLTNPNALCSCNSGAGQTALLEGSVVESGNLELLGAEGVTYYQQGNKHYALVSSAADHGIQIIDITDPTDITAAGKLADSGSLLLNDPRGVVVHTIGNRHYAVVAADKDDGVQIVDVTDPATPVAKANVGHASGRLLDGAHDVDTFQVGDRHYAIVAAANSNGLQIIELTVTAAGVSATDTVTLTVEQSGKSVDSHGAKIGGEAVDTEEIDKPGGGTATYISMRFSADNVTQSVAYSLLAQPTGAVTVEAMIIVQNAPYGTPGYEWSWDAVSVSPSRLTFTTQNWSAPQTINITSNADPDHIAEQAIVVFRSSGLGKYTGIHITVDDPHPSSRGTEGELGILEMPEDFESSQQHEESEPERQPQQESKQGPKQEPEQEPIQEPEPEPEPEPDPEPRDCSGLRAAFNAAVAAYTAAVSPTNWPDAGPMHAAQAAWKACLAHN